MFRPILFAFGVIALVAPTRAAEPDLSGNWLLTYSSRAGVEQSFAIIAIEKKEGKTAATVIYSPFKNKKIAVSGFERADGSAVKFQTDFNNWAFEGTLDPDGKSVTGNFGPATGPFRARLVRTDKSSFSRSEAVTRGTLPGPVAESDKLQTAPFLLRAQANKEKDAQKKKDLLDKASEAQKVFDEKRPGLLRETIATQAGTLFALDASLDLLRGLARNKVTADEAKKLVPEIEKAVLPFGKRYASTVEGQVLDSLAYHKGMEAIALPIAEKLGKNFSDHDSPLFQSQVLSAHIQALQAMSVPGKDATLKKLTATVDQLETKLDAEYQSTVPPFKPVPYAGRKNKDANQVVVMELFTGAQCPPCVAADVAFDALQKSYKPAELVLIQYHLHIPGPDPLTNAETVARWEYYKDEFPMDVRGTPTTLFNGKPGGGGGGGMMDAEEKYDEYRELINPLLEKTTSIKLAGSAERSGEKVNISIEVDGVEKDELRLRLLLVEDTIKYVGGNQLRFHHQVVRAMPGGVEGVAVKEKSFKHDAAVDLAALRKELTTYLDDYALNTREFPRPQRPMDLKSLRVIALVQNDKTREIAQARQIEIKNGNGGE